MPRVVPPIEAKGSSDLPPSIIESVSGFSAGLIATLAVHPFDVLKTRLQCTYLNRRRKWRQRLTKAQ
jgi:solute carrier family 25 folate transporter 32